MHFPSKGHAAGNRQISQDRPGQDETAPEKRRHDSCQPEIGSRLQVPDGIPPAPGQGGYPPPVQTVMQPQKEKERCSCRHMRCHAEKGESHQKEKTYRHAGIGEPAHPRAVHGLFSQIQGFHPLIHGISRTGRRGIAHMKAVQNNRIGFRSPDGFHRIGQGTAAGGAEGNDRLSG